MHLKRYGEKDWTCMSYFDIWYFNMSDEDVKFVELMWEQLNSKLTWFCSFLHKQVRAVTPTHRCTLHRGDGSELEWKAAGGIASTNWILIYLFNIQNVCQIFCIIKNFLLYLNKLKCIDLITRHGYLHHSLDDFWLKRDLVRKWPHSSIPFPCAKQCQPRSWYIW